jgi:hypothetical protein
VINPYRKKIKVPPDEENTSSGIKKKNDLNIIRA